MTGGFATRGLARRYGNTGVMTFIVGPDGATYERDLGADTANAVKAITAFNPDKNWHNVVAADPRRRRQETE